ncbi:gamma-butyrobetaine hydroxylase-like domain-containing protein [Methylophaga frappieri]|nr:DUF971 domain-containing protein [Methylophaga frappieri]
MAKMPIPTDITLHQKSRQLSLSYDAQHFHLSAEYLRVHSPSAEVQGHGPGQDVLQTNKESVAILKIEPVGHYAIKIYFDDGHDSGLFTWDYLYELATQYEHKWQTYLQRLQQAGFQRSTV